MNVVSGSYTITNFGRSSCSTRAAPRCRECMTMCDIRNPAPLCSFSLSSLLCSVELALRMWVSICWGEGDRRDEVLGIPCGRCGGCEFGYIGSAFQEGLQGERRRRGRCRFCLSGLLPPLPMVVKSRFPPAGGYPPRIHCSTVKHLFPKI